MFIEGKHIGPAPNWYCSQISDISEDGLLAYGAQSSLVLIDIKAEPPIYKLIQPIHSARVVAIVYCRLPDFTNLLATGSHDKTIKVWDVKDVPKQLTLLHELEWKAKIISFDWQMKKSKNTLFVVDDEGTLFIWNLDTNKTSITRLKLRITPILVSACPYNPNLMALCLKGGMIILINGFKSTEKYIMLKGHDDDVLSLSWPPNLPSSDEAKQDWSNSLDLASTSRDKTFRVWNIKRQKCLKITKPPPLKHAGGKREVDKAGQWLTCCWNPTSLNQILCSSSHGELFISVIKMDHGGHWGVHWEKFEGRQNGEHTRCIFNISTFGLNNAATVSLDRQVIIWDLKQLKSFISMPMIGGFGYSLAFSPVDTGRLAIGSGDMLIRTWNTSSVTGYSTNVYWQGIRGKVTQLKWHPEKENHLAYATEDGRVGVLDILANKPAIVSSTHHQNNVYSLSWGPFTSKNEEASNQNKKLWLLYSCGDGKVLIHNMSKPESDAIDLYNVIEKSDECNESQKNFRTEIAWKPDWTLLALGNKDGTINIYSSDFKLLATLTGQTKLITNLKWHPLCTTISSKTSDKHAWLACASYENVVQIYNLESVYELTQAKINGLTNGHANDKPAVITTSFKQLSGHRNKVLYLTWSPHSEGKLASGSLDGSFQIWDAINGLPLVNYSGHLGMCLCLEWSSQDPDIIFSGSEDCSIHQIHISKLVDKLPPPTKKSLVIKNRPLKAKAESSQNLTDELDSEFDMLMAQLDKKRVEFSGDAIANGESSSTKSVTEKAKKKAPVKSYFTLSNKLDNQPKPVILSDIQNMSSNLSQRVIEKLPFSENSIYLAPFQDYAEVLDLVKAEKKFHEANGNLECSYHMDVWTGDVKDMVQGAIQKKQLNEYLVSIAALESRTLWLEACEKYASQLSEEGSYSNVNKAITYLLASHKVMEAINLLKERGLFKEALTIAKLRLPHDSPHVKELLLLWAERSKNDTKFEIAARCFLNLNDFASAARMLANRMDPVSLKVACHIASTHNLKEVAEGYASTCVQRSLLKNQWNIVSQLVTEQLDLNVIENVGSLLLLSSLHETLVNGTSDQEKAKVGVTNPLREILVDMNKESDIEIWRSLLLEEDFCSSVYLNWQTIFPDFSNKRREIYGCIRKLFSQRKNALNKNELFYQFAIDLTISQLSGSDDECFTHICTVLLDAYNLQPQFNVLRDLCLLLAPKIIGYVDLKDRSLIKGLNCLSTISKRCSKECSPHASSCAFFFSSLLDQLYAQATNLIKKLLNHVHEEDEQVIEPLGYLTNKLASVDVETLLLTPAVDETPLLTPAVDETPLLTPSVGDNSVSVEEITQVNYLTAPVEETVESKTPIKEANESEIPLKKINQADISINETIKSSLPLEETNQPEASVGETIKSTTPMSQTNGLTNLPIKTNEAATPLKINFEIDSSEDRTIELDTSIDEIIEFDSSTLEDEYIKSATSEETIIDETQETSIEESENTDTPIEESQVSESTQHLETPTKEAQQSETVTEETKCSETPIEENKCSETPIEETKCSETPIEETKCSETPIEETQRSETPIEETQPSETPIEETQPSETPIEEIQHSETPVEEIQHSESTIEETKHSESPIEETQLSETPIEETQHSKTFIKEINKSDETQLSSKASQEISSSSISIHEVPPSAKASLVQEIQSSSEPKAAKQAPQPATSVKRRPSTVVSERQCKEVMNNLSELLLIIVNGLSNQTFRQRQKLLLQLNEVDTVLASASAKADASLECDIIEYQMTRQSILHLLESNHEDSKDLLYPDFKRSYDTIQKLFNELRHKFVCAKAKEALDQLEADIHDLIVI